MELRSLKDAISFLKEDIKAENQKLLGITLSKSIEAHELQFLEEKIRLHENPTTDEGDKERREIERQKKVDSLEENKYNMSSQIRNLENKLKSLEERQSENIEESAELKKSRKDHELKKAKMEVCIKEMRAASSSAGGSRLAIFDPLAPKIAARIEEAFRCITCKNNFIHFFSLLGDLEIQPKINRLGAFTSKPIGPVGSFLSFTSGITLTNLMIMLRCFIL